VIRNKTILIVSFVLVFAAGAAVGVVAARRFRPPQPPSWLASELDLTPEQRERMHQIWSETMRSGFRQEGERRAAMMQERDEAIQALLSEEQRAKYEAIQQDYTRKRDELSQERRAAFEKAVEQTKAILTPEQRVKYEELMKRERERGAGGPPRGGPPGMGGGPPPGFHGPRHRRGGPSSRPATSEESAPRVEE